MTALVPRTIRARFLLVTTLTIATAILVIALTVPAIARDHEVDVLGARLASDAALSGDLSRDGFRSADADVLDALARRIAAAAEIRVTLVATDGAVLGESDEDRRLMENHATRPEIVPALAGGEGRAVRRSATLGRRRRSIGSSTSSSTSSSPCATTRLRPARSSRTHAGDCIGRSLTRRGHRGPLTRCLPSSCW